MRALQKAKVEAACSSSPPLPRLALSPPYRAREQQTLAKATLLEARQAGLGDKRTSPPPLLGPARPGKMSQVEVEDFRDDLRHYRKIHASLQNWSDAFAAEHAGRRPGKADVLATRIPWLIDSYSEYSVLKRKLLVRTASLRGALASSARTGLVA